MTTGTSHSNRSNTNMNGHFKIAVICHDLVTCSFAGFIRCYLQLFVFCFCLTDVPGFCFKS